MRKGWTVIVILCAALLTGCVSQGDYDALAQERDELAAQAEKLAQELDAAKADVAELQDYTKTLHKENEELREALDAAKKEVSEQQQKLEAFVKQVEELESQVRATPSLPSGFPSIPTMDDGVQGALDAFTELLELVGKPLSLR